MDQIRERIDIVDIISGYVQLKRAGRSYKGLCPFHHEKTPSFNVSPERQLYYCFGCGAGGNVFNFLMAIEGLEFTEAVLRLAERAGVKLPDRSMKAPDGQSRQRDRLVAINEAASKFFVRCLMDRPGVLARAYLGKRGISAKMVERFSLGYATADWDSLLAYLTGQGYEVSDCIAAGLVMPGKKDRPYDRFRDRLMFPICDDRGKVVAFGGRVISGDGEPKYLNTPETAVFSKGSNLYGLHLAKDSIRRSRKAIIVEGYTDVISLHQHGITNAVASLGTAFTERQARLLRRFAETVFVCFDGDAAGEAAAWRGLDILNSLQIKVYVVTLPKGDDPDSFARREGAEGFDVLLSEALALTEFKIHSILNRHDLSSVEGKVSAVEELMPVLAALSSAVEREEYIRRMAKQLNVSEKSLAAEFRVYMEKEGIRSRSRINSQNTGDSKKDSTDAKRKQFQSALPSEPSIGDSAAEEGLLRAMLHSREAVLYVHRRLPLEYIRSAELRRLAKRLVVLAESGRFDVDIVSRLEGDLASLAAKICSSSELVPPLRSLDDYIARLRSGFLQELLSSIENDLSNASPRELSTGLIRYKTLRDAFREGQESIDSLCVSLIGRGERNE